MASTISVTEVTQDYQLELFRTPGTSEINSWADPITAGFLSPAQAASGIAGSAEASAFVLPIEELYVGLLGRVGDSGGMNTWVNALRGGTMSFSGIVQAFVSSGEFAADYGPIASINGTAFVNSLYRTILGRAADAGGLAAWVSVLGATPTVATVSATVQGFVLSPEAQNDDVIAIQNFLGTAGVTGLYPSSIQGVPGPAGGAPTSITFILPTTVVTATATNFFGSETLFNTDGKGPTVLPGDNLTGTGGSSNNSLTITDLTPNVVAGGGQDNLPAGLALNNIQNVILNSSNNTAASGFNTIPYTSVNNVSVTTAGTFGDLVEAGNGSTGTTATIVNVTHSALTGAGGVQVLGGSTVTILENAPGAVIVGLTAAGAVPTANVVPTGAITVTTQSTAAGSMFIAGGTSVSVTATGSSYNGSISIGNAPANTGDNLAGGLANTAGTINVSDAGVDFLQAVTGAGHTEVVGGVNAGVAFAGATANTITAFGGSTVSITAAGDMVVVGDAAAVLASNQPTGAVTITNNGPVTYDGLSNVVAAPVAGSHDNQAVLTTVNGGTTITITTNAGGVLVGTAGAIPTTLPSGAINVVDTANNAQAKTTADAAGTAPIGVKDADINVFGGTNVNVSGADDNINVATNQAVPAATKAAAAPTGTVNVTETVASTQQNVANTVYAVGVDGGNGVTVTAQGQNVVVGANLGTAGAQLINQSAILTGNGLGGGNGAVTDDGGTTVTINTTGGNVVAGAGKFVASGAIAIVDTFGATNAGNDNITALGGTTVNITTSADKGAITVGGAIPAVLNATGTAVANVAPYATGNVTIVDSQTNGTVTSWGQGNVNVATNGATAVSISGGKVQNVVDIQSTLATGGAGAGKAVGTSALAAITLDGVQTGGAVAIQTDALATLTILDNTIAGANAFTVTDNTAGAALALGLGNDTSVGGFTVTDANAATVTITDSGKADTGVLTLAVAKATGVTLSNSAAATVNLAGDNLVSTVTLTGAGAVTLQNVAALAALKSINGATSSGNITATINPVIQSFTGGTGGTDTLTIGANASKFGASVTLQGGAGTADVLVANYAAAGPDVALGNTSVIKGFEILGLGALSTGTYDATGFSGVTLGAVAGAENIINGSKGAFLSITQDTGGGATVGFAGSNTGGTTDAFTLNLGTTGATPATTSNISAATGIITANAYEAVTINSLGSATGTNVVQLNDIGSAGSATLTLTGNSGLTLTDPNSFFTNVSAAADTGKVNINAAALSNVGATITGGSAAITATGSTAANNEVIVSTFGGTAGAATPFAVADTVVQTIDSVAAGTIVYTATVTVLAASAGDIANALQKVISGTVAAATPILDTDGSTVTVTTTGAGANPAGLVATASGPQLVLTDAATVFHAATAVGVHTGTGTASQTVNNGPEEHIINITAHTATETYTAAIIAPLNTAAQMFTTAGADATAVAAAADLAALITAGIHGGTLPGISSAVNPTGTSFVTVTGSNNAFFDLTTSQAVAGAAGDITNAETINYATVSNIFNTGAGGGTYTLGLGGSWDTSARKYSSGSETVNLAASAGKTDTIIGNDGAVATFNGAAGGINNFTENSLAASDQVTFGSHAKTALANASTAAVSAATGASGMAAVLDPSGALNTALGNLTYTIANGVITFGAVGGHSLTEFSNAQLISAAEILVNSSTTGGANAVAAFSSNGDSFVVASDNGNTLAGASGNTADVLIQLRGDASVSGFGTTYGQGTVVATNVTNQVAAIVTLAATTVTQNDNGATGQFSSQNITGTTGTATVNNLAPSSLITSNASGPYALTTTQDGAAGSNSLTLVLNNGAGEAISTLNVSGDGLLVINSAVGGQTAAITTLVDGGGANTLTNLNLTGAGTTTIGTITDTALTTINLTGDTGSVTIGAGTPLAQNSLTVTDAAAQPVVNISTSGTSDVFSIGTAATPNNNVNTITASGATNTITIDGNNNDVVTANGAGDIITIGDTAGGVGAAVAVQATGAGDTITFVGASGGGGTAAVGSGAVVTFGTATAINGETITITGDVAGTTSSGTFAFITLNNVIEGHAQKVTLNNAGTLAVGIEQLAGGGGDGSLVNVSSATTLASALDLAAAQAALSAQKNPNVAGFGLLPANTGVVDWFQFQGNTYIVEATNPTGGLAPHTALAATDVIVKITGVVDLAALAITNPGALGVHTLTL